jgi:valyl-tRNA synthetase
VPILAVPPADCCSGEIPDQRCEPAFFHLRQGERQTPPALLGGFVFPYRVYCYSRTTYQSNYEDYEMTRSTKDIARETAASIKTLNREIRELQAEYATAPNFSFSKRVKVQIAEEIVRLEQRKADYVRKLNTLNVQQRQSQTPRPRPTPVRARNQHQGSTSGWDKVRMQARIDDLYRQIGALGERIGTMGYTPQRKSLVLQHKELIRQRRQLIWQVNQGSQSSAMGLVGSNEARARHSFKGVSVRG